MFGNYGLTPFLHIVIAWNLVFSLNWSWHLISYQMRFPLKIINYGPTMDRVAFLKTMTFVWLLKRSWAPKTKVLN